MDIYSVTLYFHIDHCKCISHESMYIDTDLQTKEWSAIGHCWSVHINGQSSINFWFEITLSYFIFCLRLYSYFNYIILQLE